MVQITTEWTKRIGIYCFGLFLMALGISCSIISNLGVSPVSSVPYIFSKAMNIDLGIGTIVIFSGYILLQFLLLGKAFRWIQVLQLAGSMVFSACLSVTGVLIENIVVCNYIIQLLLCILGIVLVAIGVVMYVSADIISLPGEGVMQALTTRFGMPLHKSKMIFDCSSVVLTVLISLAVFGTVQGVREGTVLTAVGVGACIKQIHQIKNRKPIKTTMCMERSTQ